jgi:hypothetical protein
MDIFRFIFNQFLFLILLLIYKKMPKQKIILMKKVLSTDDHPLRPWEFVREIKGRRGNPDIMIYQKPDATSEAVYDLADMFNNAIIGQAFPVVIDEGDNLSDLLVGLDLNSKAGGRRSRRQRKSRKSRRQRKSRKSRRQRKSRK